MLCDSPLSILFVLESEPESSCSLAFLNSYLEGLTESLSRQISISVFYPLFSDKEEHYSLNIIPGNDFNRFVTYLPKRHISFKETFSSFQIENVFRYILKDESFDCIHIWSFKNHSFNYPFIAGERSIPVVVSLYDGFLSTPFIFEKGCIGGCFTKEKKLRISNFVSSPVNSVLEKAGKLFSPRNNKGVWFEQIGRYSSFYNKPAASSLEDPVCREREKLSFEAIEFTDKFILFSEMEYNLFYRNSIPENKTIFMEQGFYGEGFVDSKPFEIEGAVKFGFMGELLPEDGIMELVEAFNILYEKGFQNEIHIYGEIAGNSRYVNRLKKTIKNPNVFLRGPIEPGRFNAALETFDVLIVPSKWHRSDTFLVKSAIWCRKAIVISSKNRAAEIVENMSRGIVVDEIAPDSIFNVLSELERNRKRLYYFMRITDDFEATTIDSNVRTLISLYSSLSKKKLNLDDMILKRKLHRKKIERLRG